MHIIFGYVAYWQVPMLLLLNFFKFEVFYLFIDAKLDIKKNQIANKLKKNNIFPLPIEFEKKISPKVFSLCERDPDEIAYKKNIEILPDTILNKYCKLFSINEKKVKKLRLLVQDFVSTQQVRISGKLGIWSALYPSKKIIYVSFKLQCFYISDTGKNILKFIFPIDILFYFIKIFRKICLLPFRLIIKKNIKQKNEILNSKNFKEIEKKSVALIMHKGITYGAKDQIIFEKTLYYSDDKNSCLNKYNILHLDYSNFSNPEQNIYWVCLNRVEISSTIIFFKTLLACIKTFYLIRGWSKFLGWLLCMQQYRSYVKYSEIIKKFKNLKIAIIDYEVMCPKTLILALENKNIKTVATQERYIHAFYTSFSNAFLDTYYTISKHAGNVIKNSKYYDVKNIIPVGSYRSNYISLYKNKTIPQEICKAKENGKKILVVIGSQSRKYWYESNIDPSILSWSAQKNFLENIIKLSKHLDNTFIIIRYKNLLWTGNKYFENLLNKINDSENIVISNCYDEPFYVYQLCANADLVIALYTSLADECLSTGIPVLFYEYTHNIQKVLLDFPNYLPSKLFCYSYEDLYQKSKSILFLDSNHFKNEIKELNEKIYNVDDKKNTKKKIIDDLESQLIEAKI